MTTKNSTGNKAFTATAVALEAGTRVVLGSGGTISAAAESSLCIGVTTEYIAASGTGNVQLFGDYQFTQHSAIRYVDGHVHEKCMELALDFIAEITGVPQAD